MKWPSTCVSGVLGPLKWVDFGAGRREAIRGRESDAPNRARGRLIPHASAVGALLVAMIEAPFRTALMPAPGGTDRGAPGVLSARARAVRMSAITGGTNREEVATATTGLLAEGWIHGVGVRARTSDWTSRRNRGTTDTTGSNGRSSRRSRGSGGHPGPHLRVPRIRRHRVRFRRFQMASDSRPAAPHKTPANRGVCPASVPLCPT